MRQTTNKSEHHNLRGNGRLDWWEEKHIIQLKKELHNQILISFLDLLAENAGTWIGIEQVCKALGCSYYKLRGNLSYLTKFIKQHFDHNPKAWWPVEIERDNKQSRGFIATYRMHPQIAQWWRGTTLS
jgi:hypothetical protein